jgi:hypothetical protein
MPNSAAEVSGLWVKSWDATVALLPNATREHQLDMALLAFIKVQVMDNEEIARSKVRAALAFVFECAVASGTHSRAEFDSALDRLDSKGPAEKKPSAGLLDRAWRWAAVTVAMRLKHPRRR